MIRSAESFNAVTKYVATSSTEPLAWANSVALRGDVAAEVARLKQEDGPTLLTQGSSVLLQTLLAHDLVDEFRLLVFPLVLGPGKRLFGQGTKPGALKLAATTVSTTGVFMGVYEPRGRGRARDRSSWHDPVGGRDRAPGADGTRGLRAGAALPSLPSLPSAAGRGEGRGGKPASANPMEQPDGLPAARVQPGGARPRPAAAGPALRRDRAARGREPAPRRAARGGAARQAGAVPLLRPGAGGARRAGARRAACSCFIPTPRSSPRPRSGCWRRTGCSASPTRSRSTSRASRRMARAASRCCNC